MSTPRALTFDLWDTLIQEVPRKNPTLGKVRIREMHSKLHSFGLDYPIDAMDRAYQLSGEYCDEVWSRHRDLPADDHLIFMLTCLDPKLTSSLNESQYELLRQTYVGILLKHPPVLMEGAEKSLSELSSRGFRIGMISNTGRTPGDILRIVLRRLKIDAYFDHMTFSNEVLIRKPDEEIFLHTLRKMHSSPKTALHIGDDYEGDFLGAKNAGMQALLVDRENGSESSEGRIGSLLDLLNVL